MALIGETIPTNLSGTEFLELPIKEDYKMRFFLIIAIIVILLGLLFIALDNMAEYGISGLILAVISIFSLYRVFRYVYHGIGEGSSKSNSGPIDYLFFGEAATKPENDEW